ncbi:hypothetical protein KM043_004821 [Ampulex compressa]|nr:hypothetical protein KM043_004821 [Ampulex compressa]
MSRGNESSYFAAHFGRRPPADIEAFGSSTYLSIPEKAPGRRLDRKYGQRRAAIRERYRDIRRVDVRLRERFDQRVMPPRRMAVTFRASSPREGERDDSESLEKLDARGVGSI